MAHMKGIGCTYLQPKGRFVELSIKVQPTLVKLIFTVYKPLQGTLFERATDWAVRVRGSSTMAQMKGIGCTYLQPKGRFVELSIKVQPTFIKLVQFSDLILN